MPIKFETPAGDELKVALDNYHNGRICVQLVYAKSGFNYATLSVNVPDAPKPAENQFYAKTWSENAGIAADALASGHFRDTGERVPTGFVYAELWEFTNPADILA